ncbi:hypothetical protein [Dokdonella sp.]|uniref:hypothetical protein n=1 Tax=Dokdonella sp. TaxID=2291710 RepID=UPI002F3E7A01
MIFRLAGVLVMLVGMVCANARPSLDFAKAHAELTKISFENIPPDDRNRRMEAVLRPIRIDVENVGLARLDDSDLEALFDVDSLVGFYSLNPRHAEAMRAAVDEMVRRKIDVSEQRRALLKIYIANRMLDEAGKYSEQIGDGAERLPRFEDDAFTGTSQPTLWYLSGDASSVLRYSFPLREGVRVVVTAHPWCPFSRNAARDIEGDPKLSALMARYAVWVVPQHPMPNFGDVAKWNAQHPDLHMRIAYQADEWRDIANWATPVFYVFKDGRLMATVTGWQDAKQLEKLREALRAAGVE